MKWISRLGSVLLFVVFFTLAIKNTQEIELRFFLGEIHSPLVLLLLVFFVAGCALGLISMLPAFFRNKWEISQKNRRIAALEQENAAHESSRMTVETRENADVA
ncbi:MAG: LapA family protein [Burkholderiaceae bacterium]|jgi:uncharacterized integral membrane protein|nr:LapA family protein [Burkholderiaceae bacterium]